MTGNCTEPEGERSILMLGGALAGTAAAVVEELAAALDAEPPVDTVGVAMAVAGLELELEADEEELAARAPPKRTRDVDGEPSALVRGDGRAGDDEGVVALEEAPVASSPLNIFASCLVRPAVCCNCASVILLRLSLRSLFSAAASFFIRSLSMVMRVATGVQRCRLTGWAGLVGYR
mgnify:CR=1 FL=1